MRSRILNSQVVLKKVHTTLKVAYIEKEREGESLLKVAVLPTQPTLIEIVNVLIVFKK